jgi:alpha-1,2-mannosyltransferase
LNVGLFSPTINKIGGGELVTLNMIRALKKRGHTVTIYSVKKINKSSLQNFLGKPINFDKEIIIRPNFFDAYSLQNLYPNLLKSYLFKFRCDFLIDTFSDTIFPWTDALYFHKDEKTSRMPVNLKGLFFAPYKSFVRYSINHLNAQEKTLMTSSNFTAKRIEIAIGQKVKVLYPPISDYFKIKDKEINKSETVVTVTRLSSDKFPETIPAIAKLSPNDLSFTIVGSCRSATEFQVLKNLREKIHELNMDKKVNIQANISRERQREILQKAKFYLHPFVQYESFGISVVEAMSAGCIPVVPDVGGLREIVPSRMRYSKIDEAASMLKGFSDSWSLKKVAQSIELSGRFSQSRFCKEFLEFTNL